jgi:hypothetical protein
MTRFTGLEEALSPDRFGTYLNWAGGDRERAVDLYTLNARLSEALYTPLHIVEVTLRNRIHGVMSAAFGAAWYDLSEHHANPRQPEMLAKARNDLAEAGKDDAPGRVVAALTFGYWTAMLGKEYENLWQRKLHGIARRDDGKGLSRKALSTPLTRMRLLRNRIMHHEPILHWSLPEHHDGMRQVTRWLSIPAADWCESVDRFSEVYPDGGYQLVL